MWVDLFGSDIVNVDRFYLIFWCSDCLGKKESGGVNGWKSVRVKCRWSKIGYICCSFVL